MTLSRSLLALILCAFAGMSLSLSAQTTPRPQEGNPPGGLERIDPSKPLTPQEILEKAEEDRKRADEEFQRAQKQAEEAAKSCAACGTGMFVTFLVVGLVTLVVHVVLMIWVARDAKARGMDSGALWIILMLFIGVIGLIIYLFSRPQGALAVCRTCGGKRLAVSAVCPHCQNP